MIAGAVAWWFCRRSQREGVVVYDRLYRNLRFMTSPEQAWDTRRARLKPPAWKEKLHLSSRGLCSRFCCQYSLAASCRVISFFSDCVLNAHTLPAKCAAHSSVQRREERQTEREKEREREFSPNSLSSLTVLFTLLCVCGLSWRDTTRAYCDNTVALP